MVLERKDAARKSHARQIVVSGQQSAPPREPKQPSHLPPDVAFERDPVNAIVVDENARLTHHLVKDPLPS